MARGFHAWMLDTARESLPGLAAFAAASALAAVFATLHGSLAVGPAKQASRLVFGLILFGPALFYVLRRRRAAQPGTAAAVLLASTSTAMVASYLFGVSFYLFYPADFLMWSETDFVNDILKFRVGYPLFSAEANNESYTYTPGAQILTYGIAALFGHATSLPAFRCIQLLFSLIAALLAAKGVRSLVAIGRGDAPNESSPRSSATREVALFNVVFLVATNGLTNPFIHNLHNDALAQLVSIAAIVLLIEYARTRARGLLIALLFVPAVGFLVKQNLALWGGYLCLYLLLFDRPRSWSRLAGFAATAFALLCATIATGYAIWGNDFVYWVFYVLSEHKVVPARSVQHLVDVRPYLVASLVGAFAMIRGPRRGDLFGLWAIGFTIMLLAAYTGGINFMRHHMGPASLIAMMWLAAAVMRFYPEREASPSPPAPPDAWLRFAFASGAVALLATGGFGIVRTPKPTLPEDANRYLAAIEAEFEGQNPEEVLLDLGSFIYLRSGTVMKDRASPIGERGSTDSGDLSGALERFRSQRYAKLLLRNYGSDNFWYDHPDWPRPSGIQPLLEERYEVVRRIPAVEGQDALWARVAPYGLSEITVLVPKRTPRSTTNQQ